MCWIYLVHNMILTRKKAAELLFALAAYYKQNNIKITHNKSMKFIELAKDVIERYTYVLLIDRNGKYLCNNPKYLKKWAMFESLRNINPLK